MSDMIKTNSLIMNKLGKTHAKIKRNIAEMG